MENFLRRQTHETSFDSYYEQVWEMAVVVNDNHVTMTLTVCHEEFGHHGNRVAYPHLKPPPYLN